jgi:hypothetical protein
MAVQVAAEAAVTPVKLAELEQAARVQLHPYKVITAVLGLLLLLVTAVQVEAAVPVRLVLTVRLVQAVTVATDWLLALLAAQ